VSSMQLSLGRRDGVPASGPRGPDSLCPPAQLRKESVLGLLQQVQSGRKPMPPRIGIFGVEGGGKSTCASQAPNPIFIQTRTGWGKLTATSFAGDFTGRSARRAQ